MLEEAKTEADTVSEAATLGLLEAMDVPEGVTDGDAATVLVPVRLLLVLLVPERDAEEVRVRVWTAEAVMLLLMLLEEEIVLVAVLERVTEGSADGVTLGDKDGPARGQPGL